MDVVKIGLSLWVIALVIMTVLMGLMGAQQYRRVRRQVVKQYQDKALYVASGAMAIVLWCMIFVDSGTGIEQHLLNGQTPNEDPFWATLGMIITVTAMAGCCWGWLWYVGHVLGLAKAGRLYMELDQEWQFEAGNFNARESRRRQAQIRTNRRKYDRRGRF